MGAFDCSQLRGGVVRCAPAVYRRRGCPPGEEFADRISHPLPAAFELASNLAWHAALCEAFDVPLHGWARTVGALNGRGRNQGWSGRS